MIYLWSVLEREKTMNNVSRVKKNKKIYGQKVVVKSYKIHKIVFVILFISLLCNALTIYHFATFNHHKVKIVTKTKIKKETVVPENIVFLGDSLTDFWDLKKYFPDNHVVNSGINGNSTDDILKDMDNRVYRYNPSKVFLLIGTNDTIYGKSNDYIVNNIFKITSEIKGNRPDAEVYVESIYPINNTDDDKISHSMVKDRTNTRIKKLNSMIKERAEKEKITYIDMYDKLTDDDGNLNIDYTKEGLHMNDKGYEVIAKEIKKYF